MMELSEEMKRLNDGFHNLESSFKREQARLKEPGGNKKGCIWLQKRISLAEAWVFAFVAGILAAIRMDD